ncbi:hypothetical protein SAMN02799622_00531 [Methylobacterium sp. UNC378MF]|uniref:hypothetical protein n=1 Tax=Methylobacterium sp. UNC378MF TaxID=1502748 RepID=UPI00088D57F6|nr:hypothetical protein [Methylobacterium sp. UNC378MF]SDA11120.1 hypothetical protein SAMN02799622_00531 [Methylobacterium sp. UNC378MF]
MDQDREMSKEPPISDGPSYRPRDETIAQTGGGLPNDTGQLVEIDDAEAARIEQKIRDL